MKRVKSEEERTVLLSVEIPPAIKAAKAITNVKSVTLPPIISPKESSGILLRAEMMPTKRFGIDVPNAIIMNAATNSRHPKNLAILAKAVTIHFPDNARTIQEITKTKM